MTKYTPDKLIEFLDEFLSYYSQRHIGEKTITSRDMSKLKEIKEKLKDYDYFRSELDKYHKADIEGYMGIKPQPEEDTAAWMDRVHELEVELAKARKPVGTKDELALIENLADVDWLTEEDMICLQSIRKKLSPESERGVG